MPAGVVFVVEIVKMEVLFPPERPTVDGLSDSVGPAGETAAARFTKPVKPPMPPTVIVELFVVPAVIDTVVGLAETEKSSVDSFQPVSGCISQ